MATPMQSVEQQQKIQHTINGDRIELRLFFFCFWFKCESFLSGIVSEHTNVYILSDIKEE